MTTRFVYRSAVEAEIARSAWAVAACRVKAEEIAGTAKDIGPRGDGDYVDGISAIGGVGPDNLATGRVVARDWKSALIEFGTSDTPTFAVLRRAAEGSGLRLVLKGG